MKKNNGRAREAGVPTTRRFCAWWGGKRAA